MTRIKKCVIWTNGMVLSFDENGNQIPDCQGFILEISEKLRINCDEDTKFSFGKWDEFIEDVDFSWYWLKNKTQTP